VTVSQVGRRGGPTSLFVRGGEADYTKVLIDGVPVNDAGGSFNFADLTTDNTSRIELVRGTQSAIYGSDAISGVLQILTHRGVTPRPELEFASEGGSFGYNRQYSRLSGDRGPFDYSLSFSHLATAGRDRNDRYENRVFTTSLGYRFKEGRQFRLTARRDNAGMGVAGPTAVLFPDPDESARRGRMALGGRLDDQTTNSWHQSLSFAFSESKSLSFDPVAQDLTRADTPLAQGAGFYDSAFLFNNYQRRRGIRYQNDLSFRRRHFISTGLDYEEERAVFDSGFSNVFHVDAERRNIGAFLQDQFHYGPRIFITAGLRVENNQAGVPPSFILSLSNLNSTPYLGRAGYGTEVLPRISVIYVLGLSGLQSRRGATRLKFNYGHGIKAPQLLEAFGPDQQFALGNPALKPERSRSFDLGLEQYLFKDSIRVEGFYFENRFRDQIAYVADPATMGGPVSLMDGRLTNFINFDRALARGFELSLSWHPKRWLEFGNSYTLLDTKMVWAADVFNRATNQQMTNPEIGLPLLRRPRHSGTVSAAVTTENFTLNLIGSLIGKRRDRDPVTSGLFDSFGSPIYNQGYQKVDMAGSYRLTPWMNLYGRIENLLNQDYQEVLGFPAYRLNFTAGMRFRIGGGR
jgi:outer membrane cobalamin receptor